MSRIKNGDLVMAIRGHECAFKVVGGIPFIVEKVVEPVGGGWFCPACQKSSAAGNEPAARTSKRGPKGAHVPLSWLIKIDPPAHGEAIETSSEVAA